jgi:hypothetical protein
MLKRAVTFAAVGLALAVLAPKPPASADRLYSFCDPFKSKFCQGLVNLWSFEEASDTARTSETGGARWLEPDAVNLTPYSATRVNGSYAFQHTAAANSWLVMRNSAGVGGQAFSLGIWIYPDTNPSASGKTVQVLTTKKPSGTQGYPALELVNTSGTTYLRYSATDIHGNAYSVQSPYAMGTGKWHFIVVGGKPLPSASYPSAVELFMEQRCLSTCGTTRSTATVNYPQYVDLGDVYLGAWNNTSPAEYGAYKIDYVGVWSWGFTQADVTAWYNSGNSKNFPFVD